MGAGAALENGLALLESRSDFSIESAERSAKATGDGAMSSPNGSASLAISDREKSFRNLLLIDSPPRPDNKARSKAASAKCHSSINAV